MKWMIAGATALLLVGCDSTSTAPFGLNWGKALIASVLLRRGNAKQVVVKQFVLLGSKSHLMIGAMKTNSLLMVVRSFKWLPHLLGLRIMPRQNRIFGLPTEARK